MTDLLKIISGKKTYAIGAAVITYLLVQYLNHEPPDMAIITALLSGQAMALRAGVKKAELSGATP